MITEWIREVKLEESQSELSVRVNTPEDKIQ
jgi:hypothetical protein